MKLVFLGDVSLHDWRRGETLPLPTAAPARVLFNLESPVGESFQRESGPALGAAPEALSALAGWAGHVAALANNHLLDGGAGGTATIRGLEGLSIDWIGARDRSFLDFNDGERRVRVFNWVTSETTPGDTSACGPCPFPGLDNATQQVRKARAEGLSVVVYLHWGIELLPYPTPEDRRRAHVLAQAGADAIIGAHPHVVRGGERIGGTHVLYSLGNYHFGDMLDAQDRVFVKQVERTSLGLSAELSWRRDRTLDMQIRSFRRRGRAPEPDQSDAARRMFERLSVPLELPLDQYTEWYDRWVRHRFPFFRLWHFRRHEVPIQEWPGAAYRVGLRLGRALLR